MPITEDDLKAAEETNLRLVLFHEAMDITKAYAGSNSASPGGIPTCFESLYNKLLDVARTIRKK